MGACFCAAAGLSALLMTSSRVTISAGRLKTEVRVMANPLQNNLSVGHNTFVSKNDALPTPIDIVLPSDAVTGAVPAPVPAELAADTTMYFQAKMKNAPEWFCSFVASNSREKRRFRDELVQIKGAWPLLMKQRNGGKWTPEEKVELKTMVRSASSVSPYLFIWAIPGSMLLLPFLAWFLDKQRKRKARQAGHKLH